MKKLVFEENFKTNFVLEKKKTKLNYNGKKKVVYSLVFLKMSAGKS